MNRTMMRRLALLLATVLALFTTLFALAEPAGETELPAPGEYGGEYAEQEVMIGDSGEDGKTEAETEETPQGLSLAANKVTLGVRETFNLSPSGAYSGVLIFKSSNTKVATVTKYGKVTAKKRGMATISAILSGKTVAQCKVTVKNAPSKVTMSKTMATLYAGHTLKLKAKLPSGSASNKLTWSSSNKSVATVDNKGKVIALKTGNATITVKTYNGKKATCKVTVKTKETPTQQPTQEPTQQPTQEPTPQPTPEPTPVPTQGPSTLTVAESNITVYEGSSYGVRVTFTLYGTVRWTTSNSSVATCKWSGSWSGDDTILYVNGNSAGSATITITNDQNSDYATIFVNVVEAPSGTLFVNPTSVSMNVGESKNVTVTFTCPSGTVRWTSSNTSVATCAWSGGWSGDDTTLVVTGNSTGTATITISNDQNSDTATLSVTVNGGGGGGGEGGEGGDDGTMYRALLVGQANFSDSPLPACEYDVRNMAAMLGSVHGPNGGTYKVTQKFNISRDELFNSITQAYSGADDDDVSLFYYSGHGDSTDYIEEYPSHPEYADYCGALPMIPESSSNWVMLKELAAALKAIPGKMIIIVDTCGSGAGVYSESDPQNNTAKAFDKALIQAFADADPGVKVVKHSNSLTKGDDANVGEYRVANKFYVLTAARYNESSWCTGTYGFFTKWLIDGVGTSGSMPADQRGDGNGVVTLNELFSYISSVGDNHQFSGGVYQHVQVYPKNSGFEMFK